MEHHVRRARPESGFQQGATCAPFSITSSTWTLTAQLAEFKQRHRTETV